MNLEVTMPGGSGGGPR